MADNVKVAPLALGNYIVEFGTVVDGGGMPEDANMNKIGWMLEGSYSDNTDAGTPKEVFETSHIRRGYKAVQPAVGMTFELIGIPEDAVTDFWDATVSGTGDTKTIAVKSFNPQKQFAVRFSTPDVPGSERLGFPLCEITMGVPVWSEDNAYTCSCTVSVLTPADNVPLVISYVPAAPSA
jgi:hypothetical protein